MDEIERMAEEYVRHNEHSQALQKILDDLKKHLTEYIESSGETDERGNQYLPAGRFMLRRQRRESRPSLNKDRAEQWAKEQGIWDKVSRTVEVLDEDALVGYIFENRDTDGLEEEFQNLHDPPKITFAFMKPVEEEQYDY